MWVGPKKLEPAYIGSGWAASPLISGWVGPARRVAGLARLLFKKKISAFFCSENYLFFLLKLISLLSFFYVFFLFVFNFNFFRLFFMCVRFQIFVLECVTWIYEFKYILNIWGRKYRRNHGYMLLRIGMQKKSFDIVICYRYFSFVVGQQQKRKSWRLKNI